MSIVAHTVRGPIARWLRRLFLIVGTVLLAFVGLSLAEGQIFQTYRSWQLDRATVVIAANKVLPAVPSTTSLPAIAPASPQPETGSSLGRLEISRLGISVIVLEGIDESILRHAAGHIPGTALPGESGNAAIAGHRDTFFRALRNIRQDDVVTLTTTASIVHYQVDSISIVSPEESAVLNDSGGSLLTLVTCYPFYFVGPAPQRFIVRAHRI
jgi:sortase A